MTLERQKNGRHLSVLVIAAGNSSRLGQAKQLISFNGGSLLQNTLNLAQQISPEVICVLGSESDSLAKQIDSEIVKVMVNTNWAVGMGSSIAIGVQSLSDNSDAVLILLCDQYLLTTSDLNLLVNSYYKNNNQINASQYFDEKLNASTLGAPAIFPREYFSGLKKLQQKGAKALLMKNLDSLVRIDLNNAATDLDSKEDLQALNLLQRNQ